MQMRATHKGWRETVTFATKCCNERLNKETIKTSPAIAHEGKTPAYNKIPNFEVGAHLGRKGEYPKKGPYWTNQLTITFLFN